MTQPISATDPYALFDLWFAEATEKEINDPSAMNLATVDADGKVSSRMVLMRIVDRHGFCFFTNTASRKGRELKANTHAALCFHWKSLRRQVRVEGVAQPVTPDEADDYFSSRPRGSQIGAWASEQSNELAARGVLEERVREYEKKFAGIDVPRPPYWSGYRIVPRLIEFWQDMPFRLHDRVEFTLSPTGAWVQKRLYP